MAKKKAVKKAAKKKVVKKKPPPKKKKAAKKKVAKKPPSKKTKGIARRERPDTQIRHARLTELAIATLRSRMSEGTTLAVISKALRISPWHLSRIFREQEGELFSRFVKRERLKVAKRLLRDVTLNISDVAHQCGFKNPDHFSTWFRSTWRRRSQQLTPTAFRARILRK